MSKAKILEELAKRAESGADSLAMDFASRMQRAKEQGFLKKIGDENAGLGDITSGSNRQAAEDKKVDFDYLRDKTFYSGGIPRQYAVGDADMMKRDSGTYITDDRDVADTYGDSIPLLTNASRTKVIDFNGNDWDDIPDEVKKEYSNLRIGKGDPATDIIVDHEKKTGNFDSVLFKNIVDNKSGGGYGMPPSNVLNVFDPSNIRSTNAAFDPAKKDSSNLLADMGAGLAATGGIASMLNDAIDYGQGINQLGSNLIGGIAESLGEDALSGLSAIFSGDPYARVDLPDYSYPMTSESGQRMSASLADLLSPYSQSLNNFVDEYSDEGAEYSPFVGAARRTLFDMPFVGDAISLTGALRDKATSSWDELTDYARSDRLRRGR